MWKRSRAIPSSLLQWTRNMIALRKLFQVFGRGTLTFLNPTNRKILAYLRDLDRGDGFHETVLCVANLSRFAQPVALDLAGYAGFDPVEMLGYVRFPVVTMEPYPLTLAPYSFLWLELQPAGVPAELPAELAGEAPSEIETQSALPNLARSWAELLASVLEPALLDWLPRQRWFGAKTRTIETVHASRWVELAPNRAGAESAPFEAAGSAEVTALPPALFFFDVSYFSGPSDTYHIPLAVGIGADLDRVMAEHPESIVARMTTAAGNAAVYDATLCEDFNQEMLRLIAGNATLPIAEGARLAVEPGTAPAVPTSYEKLAAELQASPGIPAPAPLSAQPGEAAASPRTDVPSTPSAGGQRLQPRESPSAGDVLPEGERLDARASRAFPAELATQKLSSRASQGRAVQYIHPV